MMHPPADDTLLQVDLAESPELVDGPGSSMAQALRALDFELRAQIQREEGPCGFFDFVAHAAPRYTSFLDTLRGEHRDLLDRVAALRTRRELVSSHSAELRLAFQLLCAAIADHDALEREILRDALEP
jgi:hypothetical protein